MNSNLKDTSNQTVTKIETTEQDSSKDTAQQSSDFNDSSQKKRKNDFNDSTRSGKKATKDDFEVRFLISSKDAGALIGKKGSNITFLRQHFDCSVVVTDCSGPERVLSFTVHSSQVEQILASIIGYLEENNQTSSIELRLLVHTNFVGSIIGKSGSKLKEIRQKNNTTIKIFPQCCPRSSERICVVQGKPESVITCIRNILDIVFSHEQTGKIFYYNPANYIVNNALQYGGYLPEANKRGNREFRPNSNNNFNDNRPPRGSNPSNNRRFNQNNKNSFNQQQSEAWNRNQSAYYNAGNTNNWPQNQMNYQSQLTNQMNNYQQNSYPQANYQQQSGYQQANYQQSNYQPNNYPSTQSNVPYYSPTFQSSNQDVMLNDMTNQINHLNNNPLSTNQLNTFWTSFYNGNGSVMNTGEPPRTNNVSVLTVPTNEH